MPPGGITFLGEQSVKLGVSAAQSSDLDGTQKADTIVVVVDKPYVKPTLTDAPDHSNSSESDYKDYTLGKISAERRAEIKAVLKHPVFKAEAGRIWQDSVQAKPHKRELGILHVYRTEDGVYHLYSAGTPSAQKSNAVVPDAIDLNRGDPIFEWHPHTHGNSNPSGPDRKLSAKRNSLPGVVQYGEDKTAIYVGTCKPQKC
jgi:hypothetical protein